MQSVNYLGCICMIGGEIDSIPQIGNSGTMERNAVCLCLCYEDYVLVMKTKYCYLFPPTCFRDIFTFEIYLMSERVFLFGAETAYSQRKWTWAIAKVILIVIFSSQAQSL